MDTATVDTGAAELLGYDDGCESALECGEGGGDFTAGLLDDGVRSAMEYLGEDPDALAEPDEDGERYDPDPEWTDAFSAKVDAYQRGAVAGSLAGVETLRTQEREQWVYGVVGLPGESIFCWDRWRVEDRAEAEAWVDDRAEGILAEHPARGSVLRRVLSGDVAFDQRWRDGSRIYWREHDQEGE